MQNEITCPKCKRNYRLLDENKRACPWCGYDVPAAKRRKFNPKNFLISLAWVVGMVAFPLAILFTGQLVIGGIIISLVIGSWLVFYGIKGKMDNLQNPGLNRFIAIFFGVVCLAACAGLVYWAFNGAPIPAWGEVMYFPLFDPAVYVPILILIGFSIITYGVNWFISHLERRWMQKNSHLGRIFRIPPYFRQASLLVVIICAILSLLLITSFIASKIRQVPPPLTLDLLWILLPVWLPMLLLLLNNHGFILVDQESISRYSIFGKKSLKLAEAEVVRYKQFGLPPNVLLKSPGGRLKVPFSIEHYADLVSLLQKQLKSTHPKPHEGIQPVAFPFTLSIKTPKKITLVLLFAAFILIYLVIATFIWWMPTDVPPNPAAMNKTGWIVFGMISIIFVPAIIVMLVTTLNPKQPYRISFTQDEIRLYQKNKPDIILPVSQLQKFELVPVPVWVQAHYSGVRVAQKTNLYYLRICLQNQPHFELDLNCIRRFGYSPETLLGTLNQLYGFTQQPAISKNA